MPCLIWNRGRSPFAFGLQDLRSRASSAVAPSLTTGAEPKCRDLRAVSIESAIALRGPLGS